MEKRLSFFASHLRVRIAEDEPNSCKEITFTGSIAAHDDIELRRERLYNCLILVTISRLVLVS